MAWSTCQPLWRCGSIYDILTVKCRLLSWNTGESIKLHINNEIHWNIIFQLAPSNTAGQTTNTLTLANANIKRRDKMAFKRIHYKLLAKSYLHRESLSTCTCLNFVLTFRYTLYRRVLIQLLLSFLMHLLRLAFSLYTSSISDITLRHHLDSIVALDKCLTILYSNKSLKIILSKQHRLISEKMDMEDFWYFIKNIFWVFFFF